MGGAIAGALVLMPAGALTAFEGVAGAAPPGHSGTSPGRTGTSGGGGSGTAPGRSGTVHGGGNGTTGGGGSGTAPGRSGTAHGGSGSAPTQASGNQTSSSDGHGGPPTMPPASPSSDSSPPQPAPAYTPPASTGGGSSSSGGSAPPGNNGTIKIEDDPTPGAGEANHPHVGCQFMLSYFGYDSGTDTATASFSAQPPSGSFTSVAPTLGPSSTAFTVPGRTGGNQLDASYLYRLDVAGLSAQPKQGYHIKVTVDVSGSQGADEKHKVFWYSPCATTSSSSGSTSSGGSTGGSSGGSPGDSSTPSGSGGSGGSGGGDTPPLVKAASDSLPLLAPSGPHGLVFTSGATADTPPGPDTTPLGPPGTGGPPPERTDWLLGLGAGTALAGGALGAAARRRRRRATA